MSYQKLLQQMIGVMLVMLLLVGCGAPPATLVSEAPAATYTPVPSATTPTPIPPTATPTPIPPTATSTPIPPTHTPTPAGITISGLITSLEKVTPYLTESSYLQLVLLPDDGQVTVAIDNKAQIETISDSDLAQIPIPSDGVFSFQTESLEPGTYIIVAQLFKSPDGLIHNMVLIEDAGNVELFRVIEMDYEASTDRFVFLTSGNEEAYAIIEIPDDVIPPISFDMGEVEAQILDTRFP